MRRAGRRTMQGLFEAAVGFVRRPEPDDGKEWLLLLLSRRQKLDRFGNHYLRTFAFKLLRLASVSRKNRIQFKEIVMRQPFVKAHRSGVCW